VGLPSGSRRAWAPWASVCRIRWPEPTSRGPRAEERPKPLVEEFRLFEEWAMLGKAEGGPRVGERSSSIRQRGPEPTVVETQERRKLDWEGLRQPRLPMAWYICLRLGLHFSASRSSEAIVSGSGLRSMRLMNRPRNSSAGWQVRDTRSSSVWSIWMWVGNPRGRRRGLAATVRRRWSMTIPPPSTSPQGSSWIPSVPSTGEDLRVPLDGVASGRAGILHSREVGRNDAVRVAQASTWTAMRGTTSSSRARKGSVPWPSST